MSKPEPQEQSHSFSAPPNHEMTTSTITVLVGPSEIPFIVDQGLICSRSMFINAAMKREWRAPDDTSPIHLRDSDADIFRRFYLLWIYAPALGLPSNLPRLKSEQPGGVYKIVDLTKAFVLGEQIMDSAFQNVIIDTIVVQWATERWDPGVYPSIDDTIYLYENTCAKSPARRLFVDLWMTYYERFIGPGPVSEGFWRALWPGRNPRPTEKDILALPEDFLREYMSKLWRGPQSNQHVDTKWEAYHVYGPDSALSKLAPFEHEQMRLHFATRCEVDPVRLNYHIDLLKDRIIADMVGKIHHSRLTNLQKR